MGATRFRPAFLSKAFRELALSLTKGLPLLFLATLALLRCDFFDIFPPEIEIVSPNDNASCLGTLSCDIDATDNRSVAKVELFLDNASIHEFTDTPYKANLDISGQSAGTKTFKAIAYDQAGNHAEAERQVNISLGFKLTSPNGGEEWPEQSTQTITWTSSGDVGDSVSLHYSLNGGTNWTEIIASTPNDGSHSWTLPSVTENKTTCRVKVASTSYSDISNANFTITTEANYITVTSPNGGEEWPELSTQTITWTSSGDVGDSVSLHYSLDGGTNWTVIIASKDNDGSHSWTLPDLTETQTTCQVKVASTSTSYADTSDADFSITTEAIYITVTSPNGGETWPEQSTQTITWTTSGEVGDYVSLHYSLDGGTNWTLITTATPNTGSYNWTLPDVTETVTTCRVKVADASYSDVSDDNYTIYISYIAVTSPNGGEQWQEQSEQTITWDKSGDVGDYVSIYYSLDGATSWIQDAASTPNTGSYTWTLPEVTETKTTCRVKVASTSTIFVDSSDADFTIAWAPNLVGSFTALNRPYDVFVSGSYAYLACSPYYILATVNVSNPSSPASAGSYYSENYVTPTEVFVFGDYAYVADRDSGLLIFDILDRPITLTGSYNTPGYAWSVYVTGNYAYVANAYGEAGFQIINISNPASPTLTGSYDLGSAFSVFVSDNYAYVAAGDGSLGGLWVFNISDPANPTLISSYDTPGSASDVFVSGSYAYVADGYSGLQVFNISDPANPTLISTYDTPSDAEDVFVSGNYAYVADRFDGPDKSSGLQIINVSNPASPTLAGYHSAPVWAQSVFVSGSYAYVAAELRKLLIFDVSGLP